MFHLHVEQCKMRYMLSCWYVKESADDKTMLNTYILDKHLVSRLQSFFSLIILYSIKHAVLVI